MHELSVTESILTIATSKAEENGGLKVTRIGIQIGEMTGIVEDCIRFYWDMISENTLAAGAELAVENVPVTAKCANCGKTNRVQDMDFLCPECGHLRTEVLTGKELVVTEIEFEDAASGPSTPEVAAES